jgi:hypothetical protein
VYRHYTPPKEVPQSHYAQSSNGNKQDVDFVVHKSKGITTLFNMQEALTPAKLRQAKEKTNNDSKADERGTCEAFLSHLLTFSFLASLFS